MYTWPYFTRKELGLSFIGSILRPIPRRVTGKKAWKKRGKMPSKRSRRG